jgi:hypothetical protein
LSRHFDGVLSRTDATIRLRFRDLPQRPWSEDPDQERPW